MPVRTIIAKNITGSPVALSDLGVTILGGQQLTLSDFFRMDEMWASASLTAAITADQIRINDGTADLTKPQSLNYVSPVVADKDVNSELANASSTPAVSQLARWSAGSLLDSITPSGHAARHNPGGSDAVATAAPAVGVGGGNAVGVAASLARSDHGHALRETGGPTDLTLGAIATGQNLQRSGTQIVGVSPLAASVFKQSARSEIAADTTTTSTTFVDLLTTNITAGGAGFLLIWFTVAASIVAVNNTAFFRVTVDGVAQRGAAMRVATAAQPWGVSLCLRVPVAAGARVVKAQWRVSGSTGQIRPVTQPDAESAELVVAEVSA